MQVENLLQGYPTKKGIYSSLLPWRTAEKALCACAHKKFCGIPTLRQVGAVQRFSASVKVRIATRVSP